MANLELTGHSLSKLQLEEKALQTTSFPNQIAAGSFAPHSKIAEVGCFRTADVRDALLQNARSHLGLGISRLYCLGVFWPPQPPLTNALGLLGSSACFYNQKYVESP